MAAAGDYAVVFLESSLGTRFVVSFPSSGTSVADLKRQVSAQHSACFPRTGPIAVTSLQVERDGFWYVLSDPMDVRAAFGGVEGTWHLRVEAEAECGAGDAEPSASHPISQEPKENLSHPVAPQGGGILALFGNDSQPTNQQHKPQECIEQASGQPENTDTMHQQDSGLDVAAGESDTALTSHQDKPQECVEYASGQHEGGSNDMKQQSSDRVVAAADNDIPPPSSQDKPHQGLDCASGQRKDENTIPEQSSDHDAAAYQNNGPLGGRGNKRIREEDANNEGTVMKLDGCHTSLASCTFLVESNRTKQENLELPDDLGDQSHVLVGKQSSGQEEILTHGVYNGESSHNRTDVPPCVESMEAQSSSDKEVRAHISKVQELEMAGLCTGQSNCNVTYTPHFAESMKEDRRRQPTSSDHYIHKEEYKGAKSTITAEEEACFPRRQQLVAVRKVPLRMAKKTYASRTSGLGVAAGDSYTAPMSHQDKPQGCLEHASGQHEDGSNSMHQQSSDCVVAAAGSDVPPSSWQDKPHQGLDCASGQTEEENAMPEQSSDLGGQQEGTIMYTGVKKRVREEDHGCHTSLASCTFLVESNRTKQEKLKLLDDQGDKSHVLVGKPSSGQEEWKHGVYNGERSHKGSNVPPSVDSMEGKNSLGKEVRAHISKVQELQIPGLCTGQSNCNETERPHCAESTKEDSRRPTSGDDYLNKEDYEGTKSTIIAEQEACFPRRQRLVAVRKVSLSMAKKMYASSSTDNHQEHALECNNDEAQKMTQKEGVKKLKKKDSKVAIRSSPRFTNNGVPIGQKAVMRKIEHNLEVPVSGTGTRSHGRFAQEERGARKRQRGRGRK